MPYTSANTAMYNLVLNITHVRLFLKRILQIMWYWFLFCLTLNIYFIEILKYLIKEIIQAPFTGPQLSITRQYIFTIV